MSHAVPKQIAVAVVIDAGRVLVGLRPEGAALAGYHEFPGGKVEPGETPAAAAVRECLEETGLSVDAVAPLPVVRHRYEHGAVELHFFRCRPRETGRQPRAPFAWMACEELPTLRFPEANRSLIENWSVLMPGV